MSRSEIGATVLWILVHGELYWPNPGFQITFHFKGGWNVGFFVQKKVVFHFLGGRTPQRITKRLKISKGGNQNL